MFDALDSRDSIWMELAFREIDGDVKELSLNFGDGLGGQAAAVLG
jgi:hypothetical protein